MSMELHFAKSPLTEAIIEIRVRLPAGVNLDTLTTMQSGLETEYPTRRNRVFVAGHLPADLDIPTEVNRTHYGYDFVSRDERYIVQARLDGFAFSRLAPYESWASFRDEARQWWDIYREMVKPEAITRVAIRYINRLDLPLPMNDLKDYLRTVPEVSQDLPQELSSYFLQLQIPQADIAAMLTLNEALVEPPISDPNVASVLLDIDLFRDTDVPSSEEAIWEYLERLRERKNQIFLACITNRTQELLERSQ